MSYDLAIYVKVEGAQNIYAKIAEPELAHPTYNLGKMFRACMDWDYSQCEQGDDGKYHSCYYRCNGVIDRVEHGIKELCLKREKYVKYNPENGWGDIDGAIRCLESLRTCIFEQAENIPIECLYMCW